MASKQIPEHSLKLAEAEHSFRKVSLPPAKLRFSQLTSRPHSLWQALDGGLLFKILASMKMGGS